MSSKKIIAIGLEAVEPELLEKWCDEGLLPTIASLRERAHIDACARPLKSPVERPGHRLTVVSPPASTVWDFVIGNTRMARITLVRSARTKSAVCHSGPILPRTNVFSRWTFPRHGHMT